MRLGVGLSSQRIFLCRQACDMRRSFDRLACMVVEELGTDPLCGDLFLFINSRGHMLKCLYWDRDGYAIWYKRLERGKFIRPSVAGAELTQADLLHLLSGMEVKVVRSQPRYSLTGENVSYKTQKNKNM